MQDEWNTQGIFFNNNLLNSSDSQNFENPLNGIKTTKTKQLPHLMINLEEPSNINPLFNQNQMISPIQMINPSQSSNPMMKPSVYNQINQNQMTNMNTNNMNLININPENQMQIIQQQLIEQQMMQQKLIQQQQMSKQEILPNQILSKEIMSQAMNINNKQNSKSSDVMNQYKEKNKLIIYFKVYNYGNNFNLIKIKTKYDEKIFELINRYKQTTLDYETKNIFIYNGRQLRPKLTCLEENLGYGDIIQVINTRNVDGGKICFYSFNNSKNK